MKFLILTLTIAVVNSRPQVPSGSRDGTAVQAEQKPTKVTLLPYYGGAKGSTLKITELANGTVTLEIIKNASSNDTSSESSQPSELEMPHLPSRPNYGYGYNLKNIQQTALNIIRLQEAAKKRGGELNEEDESEYRENLETLHASADSLVEINNPEDEDEIISTSDLSGLGPWLERKRAVSKEKDKRKEEEIKKKENQKRKEEEEKRKEEEEEEEKRKEEEEEEEEEEMEKKRAEKRKAEEKKKKEKEEQAEEEESQTEDSESVGVDPPPEEASVAEAKPVGLAIAGAGGVAAAKPIATAVVGPAGLAIARPVGTAIAGVSPDQALVPIYSEGDDPPSKKEGSKKGNKGEQKKKLTASEYLNRIISKYHQV